MKKGNLFIGCICMLIVILLSCCNSKEYRLSKSIYKESIGYFPDTLLNKGFPNTWDENFDSHSLSCRTPTALKHNVNYCGIRFKTKSNTQIFNNYLDTLKKHSIYNGEYSDSVFYPICKKNNDIDSTFDSKTKVYFYPKIDAKYSDYESLDISKIDVYILKSSKNNVIDLPKNKRLNNFQTK